VLKLTHKPEHCLSSHGFTTFPHFVTYYTT
jgi:hypothetical protein